MNPRRILAIAYCFFLFGAPAYAQGWPDVVASASKSVVPVELGNGPQVGHCAGVVLDVDNGLVVTAGHCVTADPSISYVVDGRDATVLRVNHLLDLALLKTKVRRGITPLLLATSAPAAGAAVAALGFPRLPDRPAAEGVTVQVGVIANPRGMDPHTADVNIDILPGDSGGALIDASGYLVGLVSGYHYIWAAHLAIVTDLQTLRQFIEDGQ